MSGYGGKEDLWTPTVASLTGRPNTGSVQGAAWCKAPNSTEACARSTVLSLPSSSPWRGEWVSDVSNVPSGWGIFRSNLVSRVPLPFHFVHPLLHFVLALLMNPWETCIELTPTPSPPPKVSNTFREREGIMGEKENCSCGVMWTHRLRWRWEQKAGQVPPCCHGKSNGGTWQSEGCSRPGETGTARGRCVRVCVHACVQVCVCAQAQVFGWGRLWGSRKWRLFWPIWFLNLSLLLPAGAHAEFYHRNKFVSTRLLNCSHLAVPTRLGVNTGNIVSLPDGAEQHKRVSLWWRHAFPRAPLKLRYPHSPCHPLWNSFPSPWCSGKLCEVKKCLKMNMAGGVELSWLDALLAEADEWWGTSC